jgi:pSer/pThr/pTyr-binding forkhead associated (FHA) protein
MPSLVVDIVFRGRVLETIPFAAPALRIGRMPENDVVLDNLGVSRFHARLLLEDGRVVLEDAGSENGCFVNGDRIDERRAIAPGDAIVIGKHELRVRPSSEGEPVERRPARRNADAWDGARTYLLETVSTTPAPVGAPPSASEPKEPVVMAPIASKPSEPVSIPVKAAGDGSHEIDFDFVGSLAEEAEPPPPIETPLPAKMPLHAGFIVQRQGKLERVVPWSGEQLVAGRSADCDIQLGQDEVSRRHVRFERKGDQYEVIDLGSVNGTFVNGRRIDRQLLAIGDVVTVEGFQLTFVLDRDPLDGAVAAKPAPPSAPPQEDKYAMTMLQEVMPDRGDLAQSPPAVQPEVLAEADLMPDDIEELAAIEDDAEKPAAEAPPMRGSSRASSVQDLGRTSQPNLSAEVRFELRVRLDLLPPALRKAFADAGASEIVLPAELLLKSS